MAYLIGLDLGTSVTKGILINHTGSIIASERTGTTYSRPDDGKVEFDAEEYYLQAAAIIKKLVSALPDNSEIKAISMSSASGNTVLLDRGRPFFPAISWLDSRVYNETDLVLGDPDPVSIYHTVGWPYIDMFPLAHLCWLKIHMPDTLKKASSICMSTDYINYRFTGRLGMDHSTATTFYLQDQEQKKWNLSLLAKLGIDQSQLPSLHPPGYLLGDICDSAAFETGLKPGTKVVLGSFDHPSAARGSRVSSVSQLLISCGTSWVGLYPLESREDGIKRDMLVDPFTGSDGTGLYAGMFSIPAIGEKISAFVSEFISKDKNKYVEFDRLASFSPPGANGVIIDPMEEIDKRYIGKHSKSDLSRAVMEGTAYLLKSKIAAFSKSGLKISSATMVGGPADTMPWPQIVADVLDMEISIINGQHAGAFGAAILAGIGSGVYESLEDAYSKIFFKEIKKIPDNRSSNIYKQKYKEFLQHKKNKEG